MQIFFLNLILALSAFYRTNDMHIQKPHGGGGGGGGYERKGGWEIKTKAITKILLAIQTWMGNMNRAKVNQKKMHEQLFPKAWCAM